MSNLHTSTESVHLSALGTASTRGFRAPFAGRILSIGVVAAVAPTAAAAISTAIDGVAVTGGAHAATTGDTAGKTYVYRPTAANEFREGAYISASSDGANDDAAGVYSITFELEKK
jgi:hypothetical protein